MIWSTVVAVCATSLSITTTAFQQSVCLFLSNTAYTKQYCRIQNPLIGLCNGDCDSYLWGVNRIFVCSVMKYRFQLYETQFSPYSLTMSKWDRTSHVTRNPYFSRFSWTLPCCFHVSNLDQIRSSTQSEAVVMIYCSVAQLDIKNNIAIGFKRKTYQQRL